ncbi:MAG TPA: hypothetical protein VM845_07975 [Burkholderiaceae bacterium]|jgi:hypothetical protein|nr:hypothetical protein [Burkholderiaceae bacterium]
MPQRPTLAPLLAALSLSLALPAVAQTSAPKAPPKAAAAKSRKPAPPVEVPLPAAGSEQLDAANVAHLGDYDCEFDQKVTLEPYSKAPGYIEMKQKKQAWVMKPVLSSTGALRLEDVKGRMLMIQIANKSMVMDTQIGQRLVDGCVHEKQRAFIATQDSLLTAPETPKQ